MEKYWAASKSISAGAIMVLGMGVSADLASRFAVTDEAVLRGLKLSVNSHDFSVRRGADLIRVCG